MPAPQMRMFLISFMLLDFLFSLQAQNPAGLGGGGDLLAVLLDDAAGALHELHVALGQNALGVHQRVRSDLWNLAA